MNLSFEFFPPKNGDFKKILDVHNELSFLKPKFVSVTYGALGSNQEKSNDLAAALNIEKIETAAHLTIANKSIKDIGHTKTAEQLVLKQAGLIKKSGCKGIICSAHEAKLIRKKYKDLFIVTPGIRLPGDNLNDQARVMTPKAAFNNKVSGIVIGRSLTKNKIKNNVKKLIDHLSR